MFPKVFWGGVKRTRKGGPVDQPGMSFVDVSARRLNRPLGMREVAGSNPARSTTKTKPVGLFTRVVQGFRISIQVVSSQGLTSVDLTQSKAVVYDGLTKQKVTDLTATTVGGSNGVATSMFTGNLQLQSPTPATRMDLHIVTGGGNLDKTVLILSRSSSSNPQDLTNVLKLTTADGWLQPTSGTITAGGQSYSITNGVSVLSISTPTTITLPNNQLIQNFIPNQ
jgi:hypothetical protein